MPIKLVKKHLENLAQKPKLTGADVVDVLIAAETSTGKKGPRHVPVTNKAAREVADFYMMATAQPTTSRRQLRPELDAGAANKFNTFFEDHNLPYGRNRLPMKGGIQRWLELCADRPSPLGLPNASSPTTTSMQPLRLTKEGDPVRRDAYIDIVKKCFFLKITEPPPAVEVFYGPFKLEELNQSRASDAVATDPPKPKAQPKEGGRGFGRSEEP